MSFCQSCGTSLVPGVAHCTSCGAALAPTSPTTAAASIGAASAAAPSTYPATVPVTPASTSISSNAAGALSYLGGLITGILFLVIEPYKNERSVRFHAFQSIFFNVAWTAFWIAWAIAGSILTAVTKGLFVFIIVPVNLIIALGGLGLWLYLMYSAYQGKSVKLPIIGPLAAKQAGGI